MKESSSNPVPGALDGPALVRRYSLRSLRTFCVAARHLSFKEAADELAISASAVSHQMRDLEAQLQCPLFERQTRSLGLTSHGRALFEELDPLLRRIAELMSKAPADAIGVNQRMLVGADSSSVPTTVVRDAHEAGLRVHVWTMRSESTTARGLASFAAFAAGAVLYEGSLADDGFASRALVLVASARSTSASLTLDELVLTSNPAA